MATYKRQRMVPVNATAIEKHDSIVYSYTTEGGKLCAIGYVGKQTKSAFHFTFRSEDQRTEHINKFFENRAASVAFKTERKEKKRNFVPSLKPGDIMHGSWGYDQTNPEFVEVIEVHGKTAIVREIAQASAGNEGFMCEDVKPVKGNYTSDPMVRRILEGNTIKFNDHCYLSVVGPDHRAYNSWYA